MYRQFEFTVETRSVPSEQLIAKLRVSVPLDSLVFWEHYNDKNKCGISMVGDRTEWVANESYDSIASRVTELYYLILHENSH